MLEKIIGLNGWWLNKSWKKLNDLKTCLYFECVGLIWKPASDRERTDIKSQPLNHVLNITRIHQSLHLPLLFFLPLSLSLSLSFLSLPHTLTPFLSFSLCLSLPFFLFLFVYLSFSFSLNLTHTYFCGAGFNWSGISPKRHFTECP